MGADTRRPGDDAGRSSATGGEPHAPGRTHVPALDGVRGLAILLVLLFHGAYPYRLIVGDHPLWMFDTGWMGVDVFFVLSGFLITGILLEATGSPGYFVRFYGRRTLRIFPLYYMVLVVVFVVVPALSPEVALGAPRQNQIFLWTYTSNLYTAYMGTWMFHSEALDLNHTWSLAIEEQFYLLWPLVVRWSSRRGLVWICAVIFFATPLLRWLALEAGAPALALYTAPIFRFDGLALGALLAALGTEGRLRWPARWPWGALALSLGLLLAIVSVHGPGYESSAMLSVGFSLVALFAACLIWIVCMPDCPGAIRALFAGRFLGFLGTYSYGLYLYHWILYPHIREALVPYLPSPADNLLFVEVANTAALIAASIAVAFVSYHGVEKHFLKLKDRLR